MSKIETLLAHAGCDPDAETGAVVPPIHTATTFERSADGTYPRGFMYGRDRNPTRALFEETLAQLEGGGACAAFASGMAAVNGVLQALRPGDHLLVPTDAYHGLRVLVQSVFGEGGLHMHTVDYDRDWEAAVTDRTRLVWIETPSNPLLRITDIERVADRARRLGLDVVVDATWSTPYLMQPLRMGATLVVHSTTKYLGGHSDVLGGAVVAQDAGGLFERVRHVQKAAGAVMDPFSAWLTLRGMRSLAPRMETACRSAVRLAEMLSGHPRVQRVYHPSRPTHAGHEIARRQMRSGGAMLSFEVQGGEAAAMAVVGATRIFRRATSLGGTESLIEHRASVEAQPTATPPSLVRVSVGIEHPDDLEQDLRQALAA